MRAERKSYAHKKYALIAAFVACLLAFLVPAAASADPDTTPPPQPAEPTGIPFVSPSTPQVITFDDTIGGDVDHYRCVLTKKLGFPDESTVAIDPCTSPQTFTGLALGHHRLTIWAVDAAGNESDPTGYTFLVSTGSPPTGVGFTFNGPADGSAQSGPLTGFSGTMNTTNDGFPLYRFIYSPTYTVQIHRKWLDGSLTQQTNFSEYFSAICFGCTNINWTDSTPAFFPPYTVVKSGSLPSAEGQYRINAYQAGRPPTTTAIIDIRFFTIDSTAPDTSIDSSPVPGNSTSPTFTFSGTDPDPVDGFASGIDHYECSVNGGVWEACQSGDPLPQIAPEGQNTLDVRAVDRAGNKDATPATTTFIVDLTPPEITITKPGSKGRYLLHKGPVPEYDCVDPVVGVPPATPAASGVATCVATAINDEDLGPHKFTVNSADNAGNSSSKSVAYVIDPPDYGKFVGDDDPLAYYRLNEAVGSSQMLDSSGNNHHGIYQNGIALGRNGATACERRPHPPRVCELANPAENKAGYFPARDGHGYVNGITAPKTAYTIEAWVKPKDGANMMIASHGGGGQLFIQGGNLAFRQVQDTIHSNGAVPPGQWTHVAATWDGHNTRLYVNGVQVAHSTTANKPPSGTSTFYVGYGEMAPWFHGDLDEVAYYGNALTQHAFADRYKIGVAKDQPSVEAGDTILNTEGPFTDPNSPKNNGLYAPGKTPAADFECSDPDDLPGDSDIASCTATVDGNPIVNGETLPDSLGPHTFTVTAIDKGGNEYIHHHSYTVKNFQDLFNTDAPVAYCRLDDPSGGPLTDSSGNGRHGEYKNAQDSGPLGISGDGNHARDFFGTSGYGYINGIAAPKYQSTLEAWVKPLGNPDPVSSEFVGGSNPAGWSVQNIWNPGGKAGVSDNVLYADGASFGTNGTYGSGRTLNFRANFPGEAFTHVGFGADYNDPPWAMFSVKGDGRLYARTDNGVGGSLETDLGTGYLGSYHRFTIEWFADRLVYYVDGDPVAVHAVSFGATEMRPLVSNFQAGGSAVAVDWLRMSPHVNNRDQSIVGHGDAGEIYIKDGYFRFRHMDTTVTSSVPAVSGVWQQVVGTWDGVDIRIYVNGVETGKAEATKRPSSVSTFYIGYGELAPWFNGSIDEVAYYSSALPVNRVYQHFLADPPPEEKASNPSRSGSGPANPSGTEPGGTEPGGTEPGGTEPGTGEPGDPGSNPGSSDGEHPDPDTPVSSDDPPAGNDVGDKVTPNPGAEVKKQVTESKKAGKTAKGKKAAKAKAKVRARARAKCKKKSGKKRRACLKRANRL